VTMAPFGVVSSGDSVGCVGPCRGLNWRGMACTGSSLVSTGDGEEVIPSRRGMQTSLRSRGLAPLAAMVNMYGKLWFLEGKNGESFYFSHRRCH